MLHPTMHVFVQNMSDMLICFKWHNAKSAAKTYVLRKDINREFLKATGGLVIKYKLKLLLSKSSYSVT